MSTALPSQTAVRSPRKADEHVVDMKSGAASEAPVSDALLDHDGLDRVLLISDPFAEPREDDRPYAAVANAGDHAAIHQFLIAVFQGPPSDVFLSTLDDPFYEPCDRILIKRGHQILSHVHLTKRAIHFGDLRLPASGLWSLGTLPEYRGQGFAGSLLRIAEQLMREDGSALGLLKTRIPHYFRRHGWAVCGRHCHSLASTRDLLAQRSVQNRDDEPPRLTIRPWRQVELPSLMKLYRQKTAASYGAYERTENYWRWLISRKGFDQIFVAIDGPDRFELDPTSSPIVGYAVIRDDEILELVTSPEHPQAAEELLARACSEAIERDNHTVRFHGPPNDPLHRIFEGAGGLLHCREAQQGEVLMVKLLNPLEFLRGLCPQLHRRAEAARLQRPCELGLLVDDQRYRLIISRRSVKVATGRLNRSYLSCNSAELTRLLLGHDTLEDAIGQGRLEASTRVARQIGDALFPQVPLWRPVFDELRL